MHRDRTGSDRHHCLRRTTARVLAAACAGAISVGALAPVPSAPSVAASATAEINRQSPAVVREATQAMWRYRRYARLQTTASLQHYNRARNQAARATADALHLNRRAMVGAWAAADHRHQVAVLAALVQLGAPYRSYSSHPKRRVRLFGPDVLGLAPGRGDDPSLER